MKRVLLMLLAVSLIFSLVACTAEPKTSENTSDYMVGSETKWKDLKMQCLCYRNRLL